MLQKYKVSKDGYGYS